MTKTWSRYLGYGLTASITVNFESAEIIFDPKPGSWFDYPDFEMTRFVTEHRELILEAAQGIAEVTGEVVRINLDAVGDIPAQTIEGRPKKPLLAISPPLWGI